MKKSNYLIIFLLCITPVLSAENVSSAARSAMIVGTVMDSVLNEPIEYANIVLGEQESKIQVTGTISREDGTFVLANIKPGDYMLTVNFIGYYSKALENIRVTQDEREINLGEIQLQQSVLELGGVEATAERAAIEYQIDKKVINVSKQYTAASGSAVDVLENVPSVTVDIEGNVALRSSSSFRVLIDGRPTILDNSDALRQIPASSIENIEIITNPSAKYDPEGTSGILNIITKKNTMNGINGMVNTSAGVNNKYSSDVLLNYRTSNFNIYAGGNYASRFYPGTSEQRNATFLPDATSYINSIGDRSRQFDYYGFRTGIDWNISERDLLGVGIRYSDRTFGRSNELDYDEWREPGGIPNSYISLSESERGGEDWSAVLNYRRQFDKKGHELTAEIDYEQESNNEINLDELFAQQDIIESGRRAVERGPESDLRAKLDYVLPLREKDRFEAGYQGRVSSSQEENLVYEFLPDAGDYVFQNDFSHLTDYSRTIHSLYALYAASFGRLGVQGGMRGEYTFRTVEMAGETESATIDRWDYFPTVHASFELGENQQSMASYTRRIERARGYYLEPFLTWTDAYNVRTGNPSIEPEYIDSYEASYQRNIGSNLVSLEGYYRVTHNKIERVQSVYSDNVMLRTVDNVGQDYTLGAELMVNMDLGRWWNANVMGNLYRYRVEGILYDEALARQSRNWDVRVNNIFNATSSLRFQVNLSYNSPSVSAQGRREGFFATNVAARQSFLDDHLEIIFQVRDVFATAKYEGLSSGPDFYREFYFTRESPVYTLTLSYLINNFKRDRRGSGQGVDAGGGGFDDM